MEIHLALQLQLISKNEVKTRRHCTCAICWFLVWEVLLACTFSHPYLISNVMI